MSPNGSRSFSELSSRKGAKSTPILCRVLEMSPETDDRLEKADKTDDTLSAVDERLRPSKRLIGDIVLVLSEITRTTTFRGCATVLSCSRQTVADQAVGYAL